MFTLGDLNFESDLHEAMETLPEDLEAVYIRPFLKSSKFCLSLFQGMREYFHAFVATGKPSINALPYGFCSGC